MVSMSHSADKHVWCIAAYVDATEVEAQEIAERIGTVICPEPFHDGYCPIPWTIETSRPTGKADQYWTKYFADERAAAQAAGDVPAQRGSPSSSRALMARTWRDFADALGPPVYRARGQEPRESFGVHDDPPKSVSLSFGDWGRLLAVETSLHLVKDRRVLVDMIMNFDATYPLTVTESRATLLVDGEPTDFRLLVVNDELWSAVAMVGERCVYLRGLGIPVDDVAIERVESDTSRGARPEPLQQ